MRKTRRRWLLRNKETPMVSADRRLDWTVSLFYPMAIMGMEAFAIYPWLIWLGAWTTFGTLRPVLHLASVIGVPILAWGLTRFFVQRIWPLWLVRVLVLTGAVLVFYWFNIWSMAAPAKP